MPASSICVEPGCPTIATRQGRCGQHQREAKQASDKRRPKTAARGYGGKWQRTRAAFLKANPICIGCGRPATEADHVRSLADGGTHEWANLRPLCKRCHSKRTARDQPGGWHAR